MKIAEKLYTTSATSVGGRNGHVTSSNGFIDLELKSPKDMGGQGGAANPEELFAAGYAACFNGALNLAALRKKIRTESRVTATVTLGKDADGNFQLAAVIEAVVPGVSAETAKELVEQAHTICPYSRAINGNVEVELRARGE